MAQASSNKGAKQGKELIPAKYLDWVYILGLVLLIFIFFLPAISGGGFGASDNVASASMTNFVKTAEKNGTFPLWIPHIFCGMPSYASLLVTGERLFDFFPIIIIETSVLLGNIFNSDVARVAFFYALMGVGFYLLMRSKKHEHFVAFFTGFAAMMSTWVITWLIIGHNTKPVTYAMFPFIFLFMEKLREKFSFLHLSLLIISLGVFFEVSHIQIMFYGFCAFGIYILVEIISNLKNREELIKVFRATLMLIIAGGVAFIMTADKYLSTLEYTPYSTRGSAPIMNIDEQKHDNAGGHDYNYATMWSYHPKEMLTVFVPSYFGYGHREYFNKNLMSEPVMIDSYWGTKESEDSPPYMGILVLFLGVLGIIKFRKDPFVIFLIIVSLFGIFLSFGKNLSFLYDIFFKYVPNFNKFRAPSMSLVLMHFAFPILAGYGLSSILKAKEEKSDNKPLLKWILYVSGGFFVVALIFIVGFKSTYIDALNSAAKTNPSIAQTMQQLSDFDAFVWGNAQADFIINALFVLIAGISVYFFIKGKLNKNILMTIIGLILIIDLWSVNSRRMDVSENEWQNSILKENEQVFNEVKKDKSIFRIADFLSRSPNIAASYLVDNINGYHPAKLRIYQDIMDFANLGFAERSTNYVLNPVLWNLMNVKYILTPVPPQYLSYSKENPDTLVGNYKLTWATGAANQQKQKLIYENLDALPRAFFVANIEVAAGNQILKRLKNGDFNPMQTAFVEKELPQKLDIPDSTAKAEVIEFKNEYIKIKANASGNNLLFISEIYYPPSWKAYIDGKETDIYKTNYAFRSIIVPKGEHIIELKFVSNKFETGKTISLFANLLTLGLLVFGLYLNFKGKKSND